MAAPFRLGLHRCTCHTQPRIHVFLIDLSFPRPSTYLSERLFTLRHSWSQSATFPVNSRPWNSNLALGDHQLPSEVLRLCSRRHRLHHWRQRSCSLCTDRDHCWPSLVVGRMGIESLTGVWYSPWLVERSHRHSTPAWHSSRRPGRSSSRSRRAGAQATRYNWGSGSRLGGT
jgi:hypothetical protein